MDLEIRTTGIDEISRLLRALPETLMERYGKSGMREAAELTVSAVQARMPSATGLARESIGYGSIKYYRTSGTLFTAIESRKGFRRIVTEGFTDKVRIRGRKTTKAVAAFGRVQNPRKYMHLIEGGRKAVSPVEAKALHSALDPQNRFFTHAAAVAPHPVFGPARDAVERASQIAIEIELQKGVEEFNRMQTASA